MNRETSSVNSTPSTLARRSPVAFVTGATGLLGNNLVRALLADGFEVKVLARSQQKAERQFGDVMNGQMHIVVGDMLDVARFAPALHGVDVIFHTAAYFRDSYTGGAHWDALCAVNVTGTRHLLEHAWRAGVRRMVHASSIAVLHGERGQVIDETMVRNDELGLLFRPLEDTLHDEVACFVAQGMLPASVRSAAGAARLVAAS